MIPSTLLALLSLASVSQAAATNKILASDDVIVFKTDGTTEVMKASELKSLQTAPAVNTTDVGKRSLDRRACQKSSEVQVLSDSEFLNWDIALSPIVSSLDGSVGTVSVTSGHSIANSVSVGTSVTASFLEGVLGMTMSIDYSQTWTSTQQQSMSFQVPAGHHGVIVSQPNVRRIEGNVLDGCTDNPKKTSFVSDSYESQSYGDLEWVKGVVRLCSSETYPVPFCNGDGEHK
ncbi:hypothetical protein F66182_789 [Fusarium sp. NRRL 66182]|nr:hypothetical protein F66182_789 [Fusarium sp. NRRL 66182]